MKIMGNWINQQWDEMHQWEADHPFPAKAINVGIVWALGLACGMTINHARISTLHKEVALAYNHLAQVTPSPALLERTIPLTSFSVRTPDGWALVRGRVISTSERSHQ
jgi:hypothetical protein